MSQPDELWYQIVTAWETALGHDDFTEDDDFFAVGGDSLRANLLVRTLNRAGLEVNLGHFIEHPTVAGLVAFVAAGALNSGRPELRRLPR